MALMGTWKQPRAILSTTLIALWAARLSWHITKRHRGQEDYRYASWREQWKNEGKSVFFWSWSYVFMMQAFFSCVNNASALYITINAARTVAPLGLVDLLAVGLWTTGFVFESVGDY